MAWESHWNLSKVFVINLTGKVYTNFMGWVHTILRNSNSCTSPKHIENSPTVILILMLFLPEHCLKVSLSTWRRHWHRIGHGHSGLHRLHGCHAHTRIAHRHGARHPRHSARHTGPCALSNKEWAQWPFGSTLSKWLRSQPSLEAVATWKVKWICIHSSHLLFYLLLICFQGMSHIMIYSYHVTSGRIKNLLSSHMPIMVSMDGTARSGYVRRSAILLKTHCRPSWVMLELKMFWRHTKCVDLLWSLILI